MQKGKKTLDEALIPEVIAPGTLEHQELMERFKAAGISFVPINEKANWDRTITTPEPSDKETLLEDGTFKSNKTLAIIIFIAATIAMGIRAIAINTFSSSNSPDNTNQAK